MISQIKKAMFILLVAGFGGAAGAYLFSISENSGYSSLSQKNNQNKPDVHYVNMPSTSDAVLTDFTKAADLTVHSVVHVKTSYNSRPTGYNPFGYNPFDFWGRPQESPKQEASGSGVIITDDGYIVTNNHVIENADKVEVTLNDNRSFTAKVVGTDPSTDLALLKIDEKGLPYVAYGNSDDVKVGEWVLAVGNPFNLTSTVTAGIVSAKARNIGILPDTYKIESFIQTDAAVNPGNSGGALVNTRGELVGINSAIASNTGSYTGYSFAIPVNLVKKVMDDLVEYGSVQRGFIGVSIRDVDSKLADEKGLKETQGIYVAGLNEDGAASEAGLKEGDVITKVGEVAVSNTPQLQEQIGRFRPGDKVNVTVLRNGVEKTFAVVLRNKDGDTKLVKNDQVLNLLGGTFETVRSEDKSKLGLQGGIRISKLMSGKLRSAGIREGFIITAIDKKPIRTMDDLENALKTKQGGVLIEGVYPNGMKAYYGFGI
ncbi:MAG TPA: Do family serine endopeptidase [Bacteroidia bacterium]|nr:Do family serine endopeptidase [Bacteroidia bacterium]